MRPTSETIRDIPMQMVGSTMFGRYPKISQEQTYNMIISDGWLVPYAGYKMVLPINPNGQGRGIFTSVRANVMFVVIEEKVYIVTTGLIPTQIGTLLTFNGDVFIDENDNNQVAFCDKQNIYIYNYITDVFSVVSTGFTPGYVAFQDGYFIAPDITNAAGVPAWRLSAINDGTSWPNDSQHVGSFQTKPDLPVACIRFPARGNLLYVMGHTVTELWYDVGGQLFPYQRSSSQNIDYGCLNPATIGFGDNFVVWLGINEKSGPVIMYTTGGDINRISNDGIDFKFAELTNPTNSYGFLFKQDGHLFYQFTFPDDNITYAFDFNTKQFFTLCDENMNYHIAKRVTFFNNSYYFVSFRDGNLYEFSTQYNTYNYGLVDDVEYIFEIPRVRVLPTIRLPDNSGFITNTITFTVEMGDIANHQTGIQYQILATELNPTGLLATEDLKHVLETEDHLHILETQSVQHLLETEDLNHFLATNVSALYSQPRIDMSISRDGGEVFGNYTTRLMNPPGKRINRVTFRNIGFANELTAQFRFWGFGRFVVGNGEYGVYQ